MNEQEIKEADIDTWGEGCRRYSAMKNGLGYESYHPCSYRVVAQVEYLSDGNLKKERLCKTHLHGLQKLSNRLIKQGYNMDLKIKLITRSSHE